MKPQNEPAPAQKAKGTPAQTAKDMPAPSEISLQAFAQRFSAHRLAEKTDPKPLTPLQRRMLSGSR